MEYRVLGRTGVRVSAIGLGCGGFGGVGSDPSLFGKGESEEQAFALMDRAVELGINYFDTANSYGGGRSEQIVGRWLRDRGARDQIVLATKVFNPMGDGVNDRGLSRRHIMRAVDDSLRRLQTDRIDLYMAHEPDPLTSLDETISAFDDLVRSGKVMYAGFCNIEPWRVAESLIISDRHHRARLVCVQNEYNLLRREAEAEMLPLLAHEGMSFLAFSPLAGGWLTGKYREGTEVPAGSRMTLRPQPYAGFQNQPTYQAIERFRTAAASYGVSMGGLALAWAAANPDVTSIVAGPRNLDQLSAISEAAKVTLDADNWQKIADLTAPQAATESMGRA